ESPGASIQGRRPVPRRTPRIDHHIPQWVEIRGDNALKRNVAFKAGESTKANKLPWRTFRWGQRTKRKTTTSPGNRLARPTHFDARAHDRQGCQRGPTVRGSSSDYGYC